MTNDQIPRERPILFKGAMVRAILSGAKTQTRRVVKPQPQPDGGAGLHPVAPYCNPAGNWTWVLASTGHGSGGNMFTCPHGQPCENLWVREAHAFSVVDPEGLDWRDDPENWDVIYRADERQPDGGWRDTDGKVIQPPWRPSIHMPRWASRITLAIVDVRVERLQDISEADSLAEGIREWMADLALDPKVSAAGVDALAARYGVGPRAVYAALWESINGPGSWDANPWVWIVEFRVEQTP